MRRLPLFPLPMVLFPGAAMPLHVFEPRYRQMVAHCVEGDSRFGLLYHDPDRHGPFEMEPGRVGTIARILRFQPLPDGRSLILCRGEDRFQVEDGIESGAMYHEALVDAYGDEGREDRRTLLPRRRRTIALFHRVLAEVVHYAESPPEIDADHETAFQVAQAIRTDAGWQQNLLEARHESERLVLLNRLLEAVLDQNGTASVDDDGDDADGE